MRKTLKGKIAHKNHLKLPQTQFDSFTKQPTSATEKHATKNKAYMNNSFISLRNHFFTMTSEKMMLLGKHVPKNSTYKRGGNNENSNA